ncbi:MAG: hypothetical protein ACTHOF_07460 [Flavisolibacter sp.]
MRNYNSFISRSDRYGVFGTNDDKMESLAKQLRYPLEDIMRAIQEVGFDKEEIEEYIHDRHNRS